jgi:DNA helicase-2/ATP-dependent DNA helicase PcrA
LGSEVHDAIEAVLSGEEPEVDGTVRDQVENAEEIIEAIREDYPEVYDTELHVESPLDVVVAEDTGLGFHGYIDAVFTNGDNYLLVDWKTSRSTKTKHRRQLYAYKQAFCHQEGVSPDDVRVALAYTGLQDRVDNGEIRYELDDKQPTKRQGNTLRRRWERLREWEEHPEALIESLDDSLLG